MNEKMSETYAKQLDAADPLKAYRAEFYLPKTMYYEANGLGPMSRRAEKTLQRVSEEWKNKLIAGWMTAEIPWFFYPERIAALQAQIVGAKPEELIINGTTTTNIHCAIATFYEPKGMRTRILADESIFSSDRYALEAQIRLKGLDPADALVLVGGTEYGTSEELLIERMQEDIALVFLPSVVHSSGQLLDLPRLAAAARERNILIGFDCSHSVGVVAHQLDHIGADFAVWCNYKYLNGGLGCPATLYINERHFKKVPALPGWHGYVKSKQFQKLPHFEHAKGAGGWQHGSPLILNIAPLEGAMQMINEIGIEALRKKSLALSEYFFLLADDCLTQRGVRIITPREPQRRGGQITFMHPAGELITEFFDRGSDFAPDLLERLSVLEKWNGEPPKEQMVRIAFSPLFSQYEDVWITVQNICRLIDA